MHFPLRFKHFSGSGKLFKNFLQKCAFIHASRASWMLIFDALKILGRWLPNAYRFVPQVVILRHNGAKRIGASFGRKYFAIKLKNVPKIDVLGPINVAIIYYRRKRQNVFPINSDHHKFHQKVPKRHKRH